MKRVVIGLIAACGMICVLRTGAQPPVGPAQSSGPGDATNSPQRAHSFHRGGGQNEGEYIDKWLETVKQRNPDEFARMKKLRDENPEEFRRQLHQKLQDMRMKGGSLRDHPQVMDALKNLPPEERDWAMQRLQPMPPGGSFSSGAGGMGFDRGGMPDFRHISTPEIARGEEKSRDLVKKFHDAKTEVEKQEIKKTLRDAVASTYDLREKARADQFGQIEEKIAKIRKQINEHGTKRDEIIDARVKEMLGGEQPQR
jgi:hypothetical protein